MVCQPSLRIFFLYNDLLLNSNLTHPSQSQLFNHEVHCKPTIQHSEFRGFILFSFFLNNNNNKKLLKNFDLFLFIFYLQLFL